MQNINGLSKNSVNICEKCKAQSTKLAQQNFEIGGYWAEKEGEWRDRKGKKMGKLKYPMWNY